MDTTATTEPAQHKLLVLDVDGVLTDGTKIYGPNGTVAGKRFCDKDFTGIKKFQMDGWKVCWLSADRHINEAIAKDRGIDFWYSRAEDGTIDKASWLDRLIVHYNVTAVNTVYVGDDLFDLPPMHFLVKRGGQIFCPINAALPVLQYVSDIHRSQGRNYRQMLGVGGNGAIFDLYMNFFVNDSPPRH